MARYRITLLLPNRAATSLDVREDEMILAAAYQAGLALPSMCLQGWCITCAGLVEGAGEWDQSAARRYYSADREAGFILLCTAQPRSDLCIRTHQRIVMRDHRLSRRLPTPRG